MVLSLKQNNLLKFLLLIILSLFVCLTCGSQVNIKERLSDFYDTELADTARALALEDVV
jgi:hypothetical protein